MYAVLGRSWDEPFYQIRRGNEMGEKRCLGNSIKTNMQQQTVWWISGSKQLWYGHSARFWATETPEIPVTVIIIMHKNLWFRYNMDLHLIIKGNGSKLIHAFSNNLLTLRVQAMNAPALCALIKLRYMLASASRSLYRSARPPVRSTRASMVWPPSMAW